MSSSTIIDTTNRAHRHLFTFITSCYCIQSHLFIINKDEKYKELIFQKDTDDLKNKQRHRFMALKTKNNIIVAPYELVYEAVINDRTDSPIELIFEKAQAAPPIIEEMTTSGLSEIIAAQASQTYLSFWEENKETLKNINGNPIVDFGRVLRNAFAHRGKIHITNNNIVEHLGLKYSKRDNGRLVIHQDLSVADIINIMLEVNSILSSFSANIKQPLQLPNAPLEA